MPPFSLHDARDIRRLLTERLMHDVSEGGAPWRQGIIRHGIPVHALTGTPFTGINVLLLWRAAALYGLTSHRWLTGDELRALNGWVRPEQRPVTVVRYQPTLSLFRVVNLAQCDGLPPELQPEWPWPPAPAPGTERITQWLSAAQVPIVYRDGYPPRWFPRHGRIELPALSDGDAPDPDLLATLIQSTGHPARLNRQIDALTETLVADLGRAFLSARAGLHLTGTPLWNGKSGDDPWYLFRAAAAATRAVDWLETQRQLALSQQDDIRCWQQHAGRLMATHYDQLLGDTTLTCDSVVRAHVLRGTPPRDAVNALARLYDWPRIDMPPALFVPELSPATDALVCFALSPGSVRCYRRESEQPREPLPEPILLLPPPAELNTPAANDDEDDDPDDPGNLGALPWVKNKGQPNPHRATFIRQFREIAPHESRWTVFSDFVHMAAAALHNRCHFRQDIEDDYLRRIARYEEADRYRFPVLFNTLVDGLTFSPTDFLGSVFMELEFGDKRHGQYFTPYSVGYMMAKIQLAGGLSALDSGEQAFITVSDPACGAGGLIVAMAEAMLDAGYNPQKQMLAFCTDISPVAAMMAYVQLSLMGLPAMVTVGNSLTVETREVWRTPFWMLFGWEWKWTREQERQASRAA